ncbi:lysosomal amino acid transporter 1 homolog [Pelodytes ibericus]
MGRVWNVEAPPTNFSDCPNGSRWIWNVFSECAVDGRDVSSVCLGLISILCFISSSLPQCYQSCKTGNMDKALSIWFLLGWLAGDSCNFIGAFLAHQLPLQTYTAVYYVLADSVMLSLYIYYKYRNQGRELYTPVNSLCGLLVIGSVASISLLKAPGSELLGSGPWTHSRKLLSVQDSTSEPFTNQDIIGFTIGSVSSVLYLGSRLPQIVTNFRRRSTEGLALSLFSLLVLGNLAYGLSVLLKNPDSGQSQGDYIIHHLPWLIGSLGVLFLDLIIIFQFFAFHNRSAAESSSEERATLLPNPGIAPYSLEAQAALSNQCPSINYP